MKNVTTTKSNKNLPMFRHINSLVKNWIPSISLQQLKDPKYSDDSFKTHIIQKQNDSKLLKLPLHHPFSVTSNDALIFTDDSHFYQQNRAGIGIFIFHKKVRYFFKQAIGIQCIAYAENYAIAIIPSLLHKLQIVTSNSPPSPHNIHIFTDRLSTVESIYKRPQNHLFIKSQDIICDFFSQHPNTVIHRISSQLDKPIIGNELADGLAKLAARRSFSLNLPTPWFTWEFSKARRNCSCYGLTDLWDTFDRG